MDRTMTRRYRPCPLGTDEIRMMTDARLLQTMTDGRTWPERTDAMCVLTERVLRGTVPRPIVLAKGRLQTLRLTQASLSERRAAVASTAADTGLQLWF